MARVRLAQHVVEVLVPTDTFSPTTVTGAGISQHVVEVLGSFPGQVRIAEYVVEVLMAEDDTQSPPPAAGGGGGVRVFGYAG